MSALTEKAMGIEWRGSMPFDPFLSIASDSGRSAVSNFRDNFITPYEKRKRRRSAREERKHLYALSILCANLARLLHRGGMCVFYSRKKENYCSKALSYYQNEHLGFDTLMNAINLLVSNGHLIGKTGSWKDKKQSEISPSAELIEAVLRIAPDGSHTLTEYDKVPALILKDSSKKWLMVIRYPL